MLLWFVTLCTSLKPLADMVGRLMYAGAFLYVAHHNSSSDNNNSDVAVTTPSTTTTTEYWPFQQQQEEVERDSSAEDWDFDEGFFDSKNKNKGNKMSSECGLVCGVYKYERSVNFDAYLKELGVSVVLRTFAGLATPVVTISKDCAKKQDESSVAVAPCKWTVRTDTLFKSHEVSFHLDEWGRDVTMDGRSVNFKVSQDESARKSSPRLTEIQRDGKTETSLVRDFSRDGMSVTLKVNGVVSTSFFSRQFQN